MLRLKQWWYHQIGSLIIILQDYHRRAYPLVKPKSNSKSNNIYSLRLGRLWIIVQRHEVVGRAFSLWVEWLPAYMRQWTVKGWQRYAKPERMYCGRDAKGWYLKA